MGVSFYLPSLERSDLDVDVSNSSARAILQWLGFPDPEVLAGSLPARELAARCRRRLWNEGRNFHQGTPTVETVGANGARFISVGIPPGYLRERTAQLLALAESGGDGEIRFG